MTFKKFNIGKFLMAEQYSLSLMTYPARKNILWQPLKMLLAMSFHKSYRDTVQVNYFCAGFVPKSLYVDR